MHERANPGSVPVRCAMRIEDVPLVAGGLAENTARRRQDHAASIVHILGETALRPRPDRQGSVRLRRAVTVVLCRRQGLALRYPATQSAPGEVSRVEGLDAAGVVRQPTRGHGLSRRQLIR